MKRLIVVCVMAPGLLLAVSAPSSASLASAFLAAAVADPETLVARQSGCSHQAQNSHLQLAASGSNKFRQPKPKFQFKAQNNTNWTNKFWQPKPRFKWPAKPQNKLNWANQFMQQKPKFQFKPQARTRPPDWNNQPARRP